MNPRVRPLPLLLCALASAGIACSPPGGRGCPDGSWEHDGAAETAAVAWTACEPGEFLVRAGSATVDRSCSACGPGSWDHDADPATACVAWTDCAAGEYVAVAGRASTDRVCATCDAGQSSTSRNATACFAVAAAVDANNYGTCALLGDGRPKCWGGNAIGAIGLGEGRSRGDVPGEVGDALPAVDLGTRP